MKEAAGEANMTVITIALIGIVLLFGGIIIRNLMTGTQEKTNCVNNGGCVVDGVCQTPCAESSSDPK